MAHAEAAWNVPKVLLKCLLKLQDIQKLKIVSNPFFSYCQQHQLHGACYASTRESAGFTRSHSLLPMCFPLCSSRFFMRQRPSLRAEFRTAFTPAKSAFIIHVNNQSLSCGIAYR